MIKGRRVDNKYPIERRVRFDFCSTHGCVRYLSMHAQSTIPLAATYAIKI